MCKTLAKRAMAQSDCIYTSPTIVDLVILLFVLATVKVLPIVAYPTTSLTMTMTMTTAPVFHGYDSIAGIRLAVESLIAYQWVFVGFFVVEECIGFLVLNKPWLHVVSLHLSTFW